LNLEGNIAFKIFLFALVGRYSVDQLTLGEAFETAYHSKAAPLAP
jgi:hypothetical protein